MLIQKLLVGAAVVCACAGVASATVVRIKDFNASGAGETCNPQADGMARFTLLDPSTITSRVHLHMQNLEPNSTYFWAVYEGSYVDGAIPTWVFAAAEHELHTDFEGAGTIHFQFNDDFSTATAIMVFQWTPTLPPEHEDYFVTLYDAVTSTEARALGLIAP